MGGYDRYKATAWMAEETGGLDGDEDPLIATGLFSTHVETDELSEGHEPGPDSVPAEEALAWCRERASRIIVRVCGGESGSVHYSAGETPIVWKDERPLPRWPEGIQLGPRRLPGWEHVDRTENDPPIDWDVILRPLQAWGKPVERFGEFFSEALAKVPAIEVVEWRALPGGGLLDEDTEPGLVAYHGEGNPAVEALVRLSASTVEEAERIAKDACRDATSAALAAAGVSIDSIRMPWSADVHAYPTGSRVAGWNARLGAGPGEFI